MKNTIFILFFIFSCSQVEKKEEAQKENFFTPVKEAVYSSRFEKLGALSSNSFYAETGEDKDNASDDISRMVDLCRKGDSLKGLEKSTEIYGAYKKWAAYWNGLGLCYFYSKDYFKSRLYLNRALEINSKYSPAYNNLGLVALKEKRDTDALAFFEKSLKFNSQSQVSLFNLGRLYSAFGFGEKSLSYYQKINDVKFYKSKLLPFMGISYSQAGLHKKAIEIFSQVNGNAKNWDSTKLYTAYSYLKLNNKVAAKKALMGVNIGPNNTLFALQAQIKREL